MGSFKNPGSFPHVISFCCSVCTLPHSDLKEHDEQGKYHRATHQDDVSNLCNLNYTTYKLEFALEFHKRQVASLVCEQIFSLMETHRFLGPDPNTIVKLNQKEISVNGKASMFLVYKYIYDGNALEQCSCSDNFSNVTCCMYCAHCITSINHQLLSCSVLENAEVLPKIMLLSLSVKDQTKLFLLCYTG